MCPSFVARPKCNMKKYHGPMPVLVNFLLLCCKAVISDPIHYTIHKNIWSSCSHLTGSKGHQMETSNANQSKNQGWVDKCKLDIKVRENAEATMVLYVICNVASHHPLSWSLKHG